MQATDTLLEKMIRIRRDLHQYPELSWEETRTASKICEHLDELNISYRRITKTGVIAEIPGKQKAPFVALRADIDALPIQEETGLKFTSVHQGVMHACAHDGHTSILLGAAELIKREELEVPVRLIFQPAEEKGNGAIAMLEAGALENVAMIFGGHIDRHYSVGNIVVTPGVVNASTDSFRIEIRGKGGHAGRPHESIDAVVVGSLIVMAIQTIVSREVDPTYPSVVSIGLFEAGNAANVIAGRANLEGTIRTQHPQVREHLQNAVVRIAKSIGQLHEADINVVITEGTPSLTNTPEMVVLSRQAALDTVPTENVVKLRNANMGGEDFAHYLNQVPGCYVRFGAQIEGKEGYPAHSSKFDFDEEVLTVGAKYYRAIAKVAGDSIKTST